MWNDTMSPILIANLAASIMPSWLTKQWPCQAPLPEPTVEAGYLSTRQTPIIALPSLSVSAKHPGRPPAWADSRSPPGWCAATGSAWYPSSHLPGPAALSSHTCPRQHGVALAHCKPERQTWNNKTRGPSCQQLGVGRHTCVHCGQL